MKKAAQRLAIRTVHYPQMQSCPNLANRCNLKPGVEAGCQKRIGVRGRATFRSSTAICLLLRRRSDSELQTTKGRRRIHPNPN